jgi:hypothetical protein
MSVRPQAAGGAGGQRPDDDRDALVRVAVSGRIASARIPRHYPQLDSDGRYVCLPGHGGIARGVHSGAPVAERISDHLMVGASVEDADASASVPGALHLLACLGNEVRDVDGRPFGYVAGKRGGIAPGLYAPSLVSVEASDERLESLSPGDPVVIETVGRGLRFPDFVDIAIANTSPRLLDALPIAIDDGRLVVAVVATVPSRLAGPGLGQDVWVGDVEIAGNSGYQPEGPLHFGDLVAFMDLDGRVSRHFQPGFVAIGSVAHGPSPVPGHGIGVTILLSGPCARLGVVIDRTGSIGATLRGWAEEIRA